MENVTISEIYFYTYDYIGVSFHSDPVNAADRVAVVYNGMLVNAIVPFLKMVVDIALEGTEHISHVIRKIVPSVQ